ncbi:cip1-interacting zinc finger protein isoform X1 [Coregonus clupeaformis]|uniref:cip1-interacting zinc finger protein isoform X1 n=1 Tax=Coregonus clupeaformis TaxID=59861 RepID=UPI001BE0A61D|nr:cip1-interacting zinc finger protein isoform X1 [Coregonus clupeaformis]XP_041754279.1 cip1-interacting zinc finger protein isoform X1 [Coregonus clupeaformis]
MFNPHHHHQQQQQQQQFHRHLRQLQQLFQQPPPPPPPPAPPQPPPSHHAPRHHHHHHHHQGGRPMTVPAPAPPPPRVVNMASRASIMAPNPMLQGAIMMQQMQGSMRGFAAVSGQQFTQFFAAGARSSLMGPVPMGMAIKNPHMGFPARHYHPHARYYNNNNNDYASRQPDRKRENEQRAVGSTVSRPAASRTAGETNDKALKDGAVGRPDGQAQPSVQPEPEEPALKKQRTEGLEETVEQPPETDRVLSAAEYQSPPVDSQPGDCVILEEGGSTAEPEAAEALEESRAAEVQSGVSAMTASEQLSGESHAFTPGLEDMAEGMAAPGALEGGQEEGKEGGDAANKFYCYICTLACHNQQNFQSHMNGLAHQQRMMEIQHMSNACLVTLMPRVQESLQGGRRDSSSFRDGSVLVHVGDREKKPGPQRWCATCQIHYTSTVMVHRRTREHKLGSRTSNPSCTVCKRHFRSPLLFLEHMQSQGHKQRVDELREEGGAESLAELVAMDAQGCFVDDGEENEEEEASEEEEDEEEMEDGGQGSSHGKEGWPTQMEVALLEDVDEDEEYDPDTVYGSSFVVPVAGFLCRLCQQFYHFESSARHLHCKSLKHFENLKKYRALRSQKDDTVEPTPIDGMDGDAECDSNHIISDSNSLPSELLSSPTVLQPTISITRLRPSRPCPEPQDNTPSASASSPQDLTTTSSTGGTPAQASPEKQSPVNPEDKEEEPTPELAPVTEEAEEEPAPVTEEAEEEPAPVTEEAEEEPAPVTEEAEEEPAPVTEEAEEEPVMGEAKAAAPEEKTGKGKAKGPSKRKSGRTTRRR